MLQESRLFKILYYLLNNGKTTASELAEMFEVSIRTIYRDIDALSSAGIPVYANNGRKGGIQLLDGALFQSNAQSWIEIDFSRWGSVIQRERNLFALLKTGILEKRKIEFDYFSSAGVKSNRTIEPVKLIYKDKAWYL